MRGELSIGALVAFNMIAGQVVQPILRLSQLWQDFQQVQISVDRLGDILNTPAEPFSAAHTALPPPKGAISFRNVTVRYRPGPPEVLKDVSLDIRPGEVIGIVGPSGSGKSTLTKLLQNFYRPVEGTISLGGADIGQLDPAWLRSNIGVVLQENLLFNRTIHDNIAFADPSMSRAHVSAMACGSGEVAGSDQKSIIRRATLSPRRHRRHARLARDESLCSRFAGLIARACVETMMFFLHPDLQSDARIELTPT